MDDDDDFGLSEADQLMGRVEALESLLMQLLATRPEIAQDMLDFFAADKPRFQNPRDGFMASCIRELCEGSLVRWTPRQSTPGGLDH